MLANTLSAKFVLSKQYGTMQNKLLETYFVICRSEVICSVFFVSLFFAEWHNLPSYMPFERLSTDLKNDHQKSLKTVSIRAMKNYEWHHRKGDLVIELFQHYFLRMDIYSHFFEKIFIIF